MRKFILFLTAILSFASVHQGYCQSISQARTYYNKNQQAKTAGLSEQRFEAVYNCYLECVSILESERKDSAAFLEAKRMIQSCWPELLSGVIFYKDSPSARTCAEYARAFIDTINMDALADVRESMLNTSTGTNTVRQMLPSVVQIAFSKSYEIKDFLNAIKYAKYLLTMRTDITTLQCIWRSYNELGEYNEALKTLDKAIAIFENKLPPEQRSILYNQGINICLDSGEFSRLEEYLVKAREINPNNKGVLVNLAKVYEDNHNYLEAYNVYNKLDQLYPNTLPYVKGLARNSYNLGCLHLNKSNTTENKKEASQYMETALNYFRNTLNTLPNIVYNEPNNMEALSSLAHVYAYLGDQMNLARTNDTIASLGGETVSADDLGPAFMASEGLNEEREKAMAAKQSQNIGGTDNVKVITNFNEYAKKFVQAKFDKWSVKDEFETKDAYTARVSKENISKMEAQWTAEAEDIYIATYASNAKLRNATLGAYDADSRTFLIQSEYGNMVISVPNIEEAKMFKQSWNGMKYKHPEYKVIDNKIQIAKLTFETPMGKEYTYNDQQALNYTQTTVNVSLDGFDANKYARTSNQQVQQNTISVGNSDVDENIPRTNVVNEHTYAVIIANEHYIEGIAPVPFALRDGYAFKQYCELTLGINPQHIEFSEDATSGQFRRAINHIKSVAKTYNDPSMMNIVFYYSGHGVPDESTRDGYLIPTDGDANMMDICISLNDLYTQLGSLGVGNVTVFIDACFSGAQRDGGSLFAGARAVAITAKRATPKGNMVVFSAASGDQSAMPYTEKSHGLFTYYLLKKLQETEGNVTLGELEQYIADNVYKTSVRIIKKAQNPTAQASIALSNTWRSLKLNQKKK